MLSKEAVLRIAVKVIRATILNVALLELLIRFWRRILGNQWRIAQGRAAIRPVLNRGSNTRFLGDVQVYDAQRLTLGNHVRVGRGSFLFCMGGLYIGDGTIISRNVTIYTANHSTESSLLPYCDGYAEKSVVIGKGVWIGMNVSIVPGVHIGDGAIIGMGTTVSRDVDAGQVVVGSPSRVVKQRDYEGLAAAVANEAYFARKWPDA